MATGRCVRCGDVGRVELDHPDGRDAGRPVFRTVVVPLCLPCHRLKGTLDRAARVEAGALSLRIVLARRAAWAAFLSTASSGSVLVPVQVLTDLAAVLSMIARQIPDHWPWRAEP